MKQSGGLKYYFARYFFLAISVLQFLMSARMFWLAEREPFFRIAASIFLLLGVLFAGAQWLVSLKLRQVAVGKKRIAVYGRKKVRNYDWDEVKSMESLGCFHFYRLRLKGKRSAIYFLLSPNAAAH